MKNKIFKVLAFLYFVFSLFYLIPFGFADCYTKHGWDLFRGLVFIALGMPSVYIFLSLIRGTDRNNPVASLVRYALLVFLSISQYVYIKEIITSNINSQYLAAALQKLDKPLPTTRYDNSLASLANELRFFDSLAITIDKGANDVDEDVKHLAAQLKTKVAGIQKSEFPVMRREYANSYSAQAQEYGTLVFVGQPDNSILNIVDTSLRNRVSPDLNKIAGCFRFKEIRYKKTTDDASYISYKLNTPEDAAMVKLDGEAIEIK
jgi:hypothetical protein